MAVTLGYVLALYLALVLTFVLIVVRIRITVFVFLNLLMLGRVLLRLRSVFSRILVLSLCCTRCHQPREGNTEHAITNENTRKLCPLNALVPCSRFRNLDERIG